MTRHIVAAVAGLFLALGLTVAPANGAQTTLDMFSQIDGGGEKVSVSSVPTECTPTPLSEVKSAQNFTTTPAAFYETSDCSGEALGTAGIDSELVNTVDSQGNGAIRYKAAD